MRISTLGAEGRRLHFKVDIYGLVKNTLLMPTHTWSLSLLGPIQHRLSRPLSRDQSQAHLGSPRKCQVDFVLRTVLLLTAPHLGAEGHSSACFPTPPSCQGSSPSQALIHSFFLKFFKLLKYDNTFTGNLENTEQGYI